MEDKEKLQRLPLLKLKKKRQKKRQIKRTKTENKRYKRIHPLIVIYEGVFLCVNKKIMFYRFGSKALWQLKTVWSVGYKFEVR